MKILIVDDSGTMRSIQKKILFDIGQKEIIEAADGLLALKAVVANKIDLILMDWNMPNLSGIEALKRLKANPAAQSIPVIMVTSEAEKLHVLEAIKIGAADYIVKPMVPKVFLEKLSPYLPPMPAAAAVAEPENQGKPENPVEESPSQDPAK